MNKKINLEIIINEKETLVNAEYDNVSALEVIGVLENVKQSILVQGSLNPEENEKEQKKD
jgi:hypothetical protein